MEDLIVSLSISVENEFNYSRILINFIVGKINVMYVSGDWLDIKNDENTLIVDESIIIA